MLSFLCCLHLLNNTYCFQFLFVCLFFFYVLLYLQFEPVVGDLSGERSRNLELAMKIARKEPLDITKVNRQRLFSHLHVKEHLTLEVNSYKYYGINFTAFASKLIEKFMIFSFLFQALNQHIAETEKRYDSIKVVAFQ